MVEVEQWRFGAEDAVEAAHEVVHHDPDTAWSRIPVPSSTDAALASLAALNAEFHALPVSIRGALRRATTNAAQLSDDRLQGLAELLQNADDVGATDAYFMVDTEGHRLLFGHNGGDFTLPDVWSLTIPWLSDKAGESDALGRFGIGLKTLQSLSQTLEVHNGYFHLHLGRSTLDPASADQHWAQCPDATTVFVIPFQHGSATHQDVAQWLEAWGDAGLIFLRHLRSVTLVDETATPSTRLVVTPGVVVDVDSAATRTTRTSVEAPDGRSWLLYRRRPPSPASHRAGKAQTASTPIALAIPLFSGDHGHLHVGLPVRPVGLPFRVSAQFDPLANRRDISASEWNLDLLELVAALWLDAALDRFAVDPRSAWAAVPLASQLEADALTAGPVRDALVEDLLISARLALAESLRLDGGNGELLGLDRLAFETPDLTGILTHEDLREVSGLPGTVVERVRSADDCWRDVLAEFETLGGPTPTLVAPSAAVALLDNPAKETQFLADLTAAVIAVATDEDNGDWELEERLAATGCLVLADGTRCAPDDLTGLRVLLPADVSPLWSTLVIGRRIHPEYEARESWHTVVADWLRSNKRLRSSASDGDALALLATAGRESRELPEPLSDVQADALRSALESVDETLRGQLGAGIGRAVRFEATVYAADGTRTNTFARPADAYFIEREKNSWSVAAKRTPGLVWLHRRYSQDLRAEAGRAGIGAQRLFRLLGAESVPRLPAHPGNEKRYVYYEPGVRRFYPGTPPRRASQMGTLGAEYTLGDRHSPDLDAVLRDIAKEKTAAERRRRANALLACLARNWDRLEPHARVRAVSTGGQWNLRGTVDAWWVSSAASISWLTNGRGRLTAPADLRLRTSANEAMHGSNPAFYLADSYDVAGSREVLTALGVEGNPTASALMERLGQIRAAQLQGHGPGQAASDSHLLSNREAVDAAAPLYKALAAAIQGSGAARRVGDLTPAATRAIFDRGDGLIVTDVGWRRTSTVLSGPPIFGTFAPFVPAIEGTDALWSLLGVRPPRGGDAKGVLRALSNRRSLSADEIQIMLEALRLLAKVTPDQLGQLRRFPVYVGSEWTTKRPVFTAANPILADALAERVPIWQPGGPLAQLDALIEPLALTRLDTSHCHVVRSTAIEYDADLTALFKVAVRNLQTDLARSSPRTSQALTTTWEELAEFQVAIVPDLRIRVSAPETGDGHQIHAPAWLDAQHRALLVTTPEDLTHARSGGYAVASLFTAPARDIAYAWVVAWSDAAAGKQAEVVVTAAERAAEDKLRREASASALLHIGNAADQRRNAAQATNRRGPKSAEPRSESGVSVPLALPQPARRLIDLDGLVVRVPDDASIPSGSPGRPHDDEGVPAPTACSTVAARGEPGLRDPVRSNPSKPPAPGRGPLNYTAEERESLGLELLRLLLAADDATLTDVRHQPNVGADAVDDHGRFFELKVHAGAIPDSVRLEDSQVQRALTNTEFYLVLVGNVEIGQGAPEVRIIHDPLHHLTPEPRGSVHLTGIHSADTVLVRHFEHPDDRSQV
ncbi:sacsin N-terminal ATP-binding-like domain-containing protein [Cellulomonas sp.]|uniref:sacsin N-terminal ATP-binding-like domain-containing protein n=1 Tax=Cellulomonas sp. TaxID=40001 RepID=UPI003BA9E74F